DPIGTWNCASWVRDAVLYMDLNVQVPLLVIAPWFLPTRVNPSQGLLSIWDAEGWACADPYGINNTCSTTYLAATSTRPPRRDPLAIDLDGDGIETRGIGETPITFDHNADGVRTGTG